MTTRELETEALDSANELARAIGGPGSGRRRTRWLALGGAALLVGVALVVAYVLLRHGDDDAGRYRTAGLRRGTLTVTVSATGTLQPTNQVDVGSELSGVIAKVLVDDNDRVKKGQLLAQLDTTRLSQQVARSRAALRSARARLLQARATVAETRVNHQRLTALFRVSHGQAPSRAELSTAAAQLARARADQAMVRAAIAEARAALDADLTNLTKASIRSPIDGVVLTRKVEPGQTVAATLQAPVLFVLAEDLKTMELKVDVDEADVGHVRDGQRATFSVDAYPKRRFDARIVRVGLGSQVKDGVVSYPTALAVRNDDLALRPGMTATCEIVTATRASALLLPNAALRFVPEAGATRRRRRGLVAKLMPRPPHVALRKPAKTPRAGGSARVWVLRDGALAARHITVGESDGRETEVLSGPLSARDRVVVEQVRRPGGAP